MWARMRNENVGAYPKRWPQIAQRVRRMNGWRCERCHHPSKPHTAEWNQPCDDQCTHPGIGDGKMRVLTVHHLDGNKSNCRLWNLAALCQVCHLQVQGRVAWYQGWPLPHTPWMQKHVDRYERERLREERRALLRVQGYRVTEFTYVDGALNGCWMAPE